MRYIIYKITDDKKSIEIEKEAPSSETYDDFKASFPADMPRYAVVDFPYTNSDGVEKADLIFVAWSPDDANVKMKMLYASSLDAIKKKLPGYKEMAQCNDQSDLEVDEMKT